MRTQALFVFGILALSSVFVSCGSSSSIHDSGGNEKGDFRSIEGRVSKSLDAEWREGEILIGNGVKVSAFYFIDQDAGWACNNDFVIHTIDGGKSWRSNPIDFAKDAAISFIQFTNDSDGWLILQEGGENGWSKAAAIKIYKTVDSGKTWTFSHTEAAAYFVDAYFAGDRGWVIATRFIGFTPQRLSPVVISFSKESNWTDYSGPIKKLSYEPASGDENFPQLASVSVSKANCVAIIDQAERIFKSCDDGKIWEKTEHADAESPYSGYWVNELNIEDGFSWYVQSTGGIDHLPGTLLSIIPTDSKTGPTKASIAGYIVSNGFYNSQKEFYLAGGRRDESLSGHTYVGTILKSADEGNTWHEIYAAEQELKSVQFSSSDSGAIWILSADGKMYKLSRP